MKLLVVRKFSFSAAHHLPNYEGKCKNDHGHTWVVELGLGGSKLEATGMVVDFTYIKKKFGKYLDKHYDHQDLNTILSNPTAENIAEVLFKKAKRMFPDYLVYFVRVWESQDSYAEAFEEV